MGVPARARGPDAVDRGPGGRQPGARAADGARNRDRDADAVVFVDSDDILDPSRVAAAREALATADVVGCALRLADETGAELGAIFGPAGGALVAADLPRTNVFGLSNSAYRVATLRSCLPIPDACALVDWLLATRAWAFGARLAFDSTPRMVYRQGAASATRVSPPFDARHVLAATDLVLGHYRVALESSAGPAGGPGGRSRRRPRSRGTVSHRDRHVP